jgi:hypothetical protein
MSGFDERRDVSGPGKGTLTGPPAPATPGPGKNTLTAAALPRATHDAGVAPSASGPTGAPPSVEHYSDMLAVVLSAKNLTDHAEPDDPKVRGQVLGLIAPLERRLGQLNDHQGRLAQFGAGNIAGQAALDMSEAAIRSWRQLLLLGAMVRTDELVTRFRVGAEALQFLTGEHRDAPTLREFNHVSGLVGMGAAAPILTPLLVAVAVEEAPLLAFAARVSARQVALWAAAHPFAALAASEALLGFGLQIGEGGWEGFWGQLQDPQGRWFVVAQVLMDYMHIRGGMGGHDAPAGSPRAAAPGVEPDIEDARQRLEKARVALQQVHDAVASAEPAARAGAPRDAASSEFGPRSIVVEPTQAPPGAGPKRSSGSEPYPDNPHGHVEQRKPDWCGAASGEMAARRLGVEVDQAVIAATPYFTPQSTIDGEEIFGGGFQTDGLTAALAEVAPLPGRHWVGGDIKQDMSTPQGLRTHLAGYLSATEASIILRVSGGKHWIVVDAVLPDGKIVIRDPGEKQSTIVTADRLSAQKPTGAAVFSFPEKKQ